MQEGGVGPRPIAHGGTVEGGGHVAIKAHVFGEEQTPAAPAVDESAAADLQRVTAQLSDAESKLAISLRSYALLEEQLTQTKVELGSANAEIATLRG